MLPIGSNTSLYLQRKSVNHLDHDCTWFLDTDFHIHYDIRLVHTRQHKDIPQEVHMPQHDFCKNRSNKHTYRCKLKLIYQLFFHITLYLPGKQAETLSQQLLSTSFLGMDFHIERDTPLEDNLQAQRNQLLRRKIEKIKTTSSLLLDFLFERFLIVGRKIAVE